MPLLTTVTALLSAASASTSTPPSEILSDIEDQSVIVQVERYTESTVIQRGLESLLPPEPDTTNNQEAPRFSPEAPGNAPPGGPAPRAGSGSSSSQQSNSSGQYCVAGPDDAVSTDAGCVSLAQEMGCLTLEYSPLGGAQCTSTPPTSEEEPPEEPSDNPEAPAEPEQEDNTEYLLTLVPGMAESAFAELAIDPGNVAFDEQLLGFGYIHQHTNIFADVAGQTITENLLGFDVEIRATPAEYHFDYGDGTTLTTTNPGGPATEPSTNSDTATSHAYTETGRYPVTVTTTFIGEYRLLGGPWNALSETLSLESSPGEADIWRTDHQLVSEDCPATNRYGCNGPFLIEDGDSAPEIFQSEYDQHGNWLRR